MICWQPSVPESTGMDYPYRCDCDMRAGKQTSTQGMYLLRLASCLDTQPEAPSDARQAQPEPAQRFKSPRTTIRPRSNVVKKIKNFSHATPGLCLIGANLASTKSKFWVPGWRLAALSVVKGNLRHDNPQQSGTGSWRLMEAGPLIGNIGPKSQKPYGGTQ